MTSRVSLFLVPSIFAMVFLSIAGWANYPTSAQSSDEKDAAGTAAIDLSRLESEGNYDALYDRLHPDSKALVPREVVVGWYANEFGPRGPQVATVMTIVSVPWVWDVTGQMYWDAATVLYEQRFADGSVDRDELHLVLDQSGEWSWFFGRNQDWLNEQIAKYGTESKPSPTPEVDTVEDQDRPSEDLQRENDELKTRVALLESSPTNTPTLPIGPTPTPERNPTTTPTRESQNLESYPNLSDVRELEARPQSMISKKFRIVGVVLATDTVNLEVNGSIVKSTLQLVVRAGDDSHHAVAVGIDSLPDGVGEGAQVEVQGEFRGTGFRENGNEVDIEVPFVRAESLTVTQQPPMQDEYETYFQPQSESIDKRLDDLRLAGKKIVFTCRVFNLYEQSGVNNPGDYSDINYDEAMQVYVLEPDTILIDGSFIGESFVVVANGELDGVYDESWLKIWGTVVDKTSFYNLDYVILSSPLIRAEKIEVLPGPPPGVKDLRD